MANPLAINDATGEVLRLENGAWVKAETAVNDATGERVAFDGAAWKPVGGKGQTTERAPDPANTLPVQPSTPDTTPRIPGAFVPPGPRDNEFIPANESTGESILRRGRKALDFAGGVAHQLARAPSKAGDAILGLPADLLNLDIQLSKRLGVPLSAASAIARVLGIDEITVAKPQINTQVFDSVVRGGADLAGVDPPRTTPRNAVERFADRIGQELTFAAVPGTAALGKAAKVGTAGARAMANSGSAAERVWGGMVEKAAVDPKKFVKDEARTAAVAGTGGEVAREFVDPNHKGGPWAGIADLAGALTAVGGTAAASKVGAKVADIGSAIFNKPGYASQVVSENVVDDILRIVAPDQLQGRAPADTTSVVRRINEGRKVGDTIPGFTESLADRLQNEQLAALEYQRQSGPNAGLFNQQRSRNTQAIDKAFEEVTPKGQPGEFREALERQRDTMVGGAADRAQQARQAFEDAVARLQPGMTAEGRGANIRQALEDALERARDVEREAWRPINEARIPVDAEPLAQRFADVTSGLSEAERVAFVPGQLTGIPRRLAGDAVPGAPVNTGLVDQYGAPITRPAPAPEPTQLTEVTGLRSALSSEARAARVAGDVNRERVINRYIEALDAYVADALPEDLRQAHAEARATSVDLNDRFTRQGTAVADTVRPKLGDYRQSVADSPTARRFVGSPPDTQALIREAGLDPRVQSAIRDQVLDDVTRGNTLANPARTDEFVRNNRHVLDSQPALRDDITAAGRRGGDAAGAETYYQDLRRTLGDTDMKGRSAVARYLQYGDENATKAMKGVLGAPQPRMAIDELLNFVGNDARAVEGARKVFWDIVQERSRSAGRTTAGMDGAQPWSPVALRQTLEDPVNRAVMERLYRDNPEHLDNIRRIADALQGTDTRLSARAPSSSGTAQSVMPGITAATGSSILYNMERGIISPVFAALYLGGRVGRGAVATARQASYDKILDSALLNPDFAAKLLAENNPANRAALRRGAKGWLGHEATAFIDVLNEIESGGKRRDPAVEAIDRERRERIDAEKQPNRRSRRD